MRALALVPLFAAVLAGCSTGSYTLLELPTYTAAQQSRGPEQPHVVNVTEVGQLPSMTPFAVIHGVSKSGRAHMAAMLAEKAAPLRPDLVLLEDRQSQYAGSVGTYWGFGISTSEPVYHRVLNALLLRLNPATPGYKLNPQSMVVTIAEGGAAAQAGMQEGDTLVSIDGLAVDNGERWMHSPHFAALLSKGPGDEVRFVWIRPGTGRMEGRGKCQPNDPTHLTLPSAFKKPLDQIRREQQEAHR